MTTFKRLQLYTGIALIGSIFGDLIYGIVCAIQHIPYNTYMFSWLKTREFWSWIGSVVAMVAIIAYEILTRNKTSIDPK